MKRRSFWIGGMSALLGLCVFLAGVPSTSAQRPETKRTVERRGVERSLVAKTAYVKLKQLQDEHPGVVEDEHLSGASLEWFKAEVSRAKSKAEAVKAASEYLEREGSVPRQAAN